MPDKLIPGKKKSPVYKKGRAKSSTFQMKGSPMQRNFKIDPPTAEAVSTSVTPVIVPKVGELVDPHTSPKGYGYKAEMKGLKRKPKTLLEKREEKKERQKKFKKL